MEDYEQPYRTVSRIAALVSFAFRPKAFVKMATEHDVSLTLTKNKTLRETHLPGEKLEEYRDEVRGYAGQRLPIVRKAFLRAGVRVFCAALLGLALGWAMKGVFGALSPAMNSGIQMLGAALVLWATIWQLDADVQTMGGETLLERTHWWMFCSLYLLGTTLFFIAYTWSV